MKRAIIEEIAHEVRDVLQCSEVGPEFLIDRAGAEEYAAMLDYDSDEYEAVIYTIQTTARAIAIEQEG